MMDAKSSFTTSMPVLRNASSFTSPVNRAGGSLPVRAFRGCSEKVQMQGTASSIVARFFALLMTAICPMWRPSKLPRATTEPFCMNSLYIGSPVYEHSPDRQHAGLPADFAQSEKVIVLCQDPQERAVFGRPREVEPV